MVCLYIYNPLVFIYFNNDLEIFDLSFFSPVLCSKLYLNIFFPNNSKIFIPLKGGSNRYQDERQ